MDDLFHELLKYLNSFPIDYKPIPINNFLIKLGYKDDSLKDAKIIKGVIISLGEQRFIECDTVLFNELFANVPLTYNKETGKHDVPKEHTLKVQPLIVHLTSIGKLYIENRIMNITQLKINKTQRGLTWALFISSGIYTFFAVLTYIKSPEKIYLPQQDTLLQLQKKLQQIEGTLKGQTNQDSLFRQQVKDSLKISP